jgi:hypothetical protein
MGTLEPAPVGIVAGTLCRRLRARPKLLVLALVSTPFPIAVPPGDEIDLDRKARAATVELVR